MGTSEERETGYYLINGKRVLYWHNGIWHQAVKDRGGRYGCYISELEKQPKRIKTIERYHTMYD